VVDRRLGRLPYLGIWGLLTGLQGLTLQGSLGLSWVGISVVVGGLQLAKFLPTAMRLSDIGRRPSEAVLLVLIPVVNVYGFAKFCLQGTPSDALRERRRGRWNKLMDWPTALAGGLRLALRTAGVGLPLALAFSIVGSLGGRLALRAMEWCLSIDSGTVESASQGILAVGFFLLAYTLVQYTKRATASRASWFPSLACLPLLLIGGSLSFHARGADMGPVFMMAGFTMAWTLWWGSVAGAAVAIGWVRTGEGARIGQPAPAGAVLREIAARTVEVSAAHGGVKHAVTIGMQVLIPGVYYAIQYAFVDHIVVLDPEQPALKRSAQLTWGHRARIFQLFLVWFLFNLAMYFAIGLALEPAEDLQAVMLDPRVFELSTVVLQDLVFVLTSWVLTLALLLMYQERIEREAEAKAKRARAQEAAAAGADAADEAAASPAGTTD